jgi:hypothetical protein
MAVRLIMGIVLTTIITSCFLDSDDDLTIVKGKVTNRIDGTNMSGIPIELSICAGGFNHDGCDSLKTVYTDLQGNYEMSFRTKRKRFYKIGLPANINYEHNYYGLIVNEGKTSNVDFQLMPYTILKINLKTNKNNKNYLQIDYTRGPCSMGLYGVGGSTLFLDTSRLNQSIDTVQYLSVSPFCEYRFLRTVCNRAGILYEYKYTDCTDETMQTFYVDYRDTTEIHLN